MGLRNLIRRLERSASGELESFELLDGSRYYYAPLDAEVQLFLLCYDAEVGHPEWPEPPEILRMVCRARHPALVLEQVARQYTGAAVDLSLPYDVDKLVDERRLVLRGE